MPLFIGEVNVKSDSNEKIKSNRLLGIPLDSRSPTPLKLFV